MHTCTYIGISVYLLLTTLFYIEVFDLKKFFFDSKDFPQVFFLYGLIGDIVSRPCLSANPIFDSFWQQHSSREFSTLFQDTKWSLSAPWSSLILLGLGREKTQLNCSALPLLLAGLREQAQTHGYYHFPSLGLRYLCTPRVLQGPPSSSPAPGIFPTLVPKSKFCRGRNGV